MLFVSLVWGGGRAVLELTVWELPVKQLLLNSLNSMGTRPAPVTLDLSSGQLWTGPECPVFYPATWSRAQKLWVRGLCLLYTVLVSQAARRVGSTAAWYTPCWAASLISQGAPRLSGEVSWKQSWSLSFWCWLRHRLWLICVVQSMYMNLSTICSVCLFLSWWRALDNTCQELAAARLESSSFLLMVRPTEVVARRIEYVHAALHFKLWTSI